MPFRHRLKYYREAMDYFCLHSIKSRGQKARVRLCVSSEQRERAANIKHLTENQYLTCSNQYSITPASSNQYPASGT